MQASTIDQVISELERITNHAIQENSPLGYFSALYLEVTKNIKKAIEEGSFENNQRMERLDVVFANRYLQAYAQYKNGQKPSQSWNISFRETQKFWPIVIQHLLLGMNAHIALDLGIAAAQVSPGNAIHDLKGDFNKINEILASLVGNVEQTLSKIWPKLKMILKFTGRVDDFMVNFSMEIARNEAWSFAKELAELSEEGRLEHIKTKDLSVAKAAKIISSPGWLVSALFGVIRLGERGTVGAKIEKFINS